MSTRLITIPASHYCEKARWALERAGVAYREDAHLPGFHVLPALLAGQSDEVPILVTSDGILRDSTDILEWADRQTPDDRKFYPPECRKLEDEFDATIGVSARVWTYTHLLPLTRVLQTAIATSPVPEWERKLGPIGLPLLKPLIRHWYKMTPAAMAASAAAVQKDFDAVGARLADGRRYLVGDRFSAADLTWAALSAACLLPEGYGAPLPKLAELPPPMAAQIKKWRAHPAGVFADRMYREERRR